MSDSTENKAHKDSLLTKIKICQEDSIFLSKKKYLSPTQSKKCKVNNLKGN